jgi:hypothetical protein
MNPLGLAPSETWGTDDPATREGIPVSADLVMDVEASDGVDTARLRTETHYVFSDWGNVLPIAAPS